MLVLALTGDIGAGKSTLGALWQEEGALVLDADLLAREAWELPELRAQLRERWGDGIFAPGGTLDRRALGARLFADEESYRWGCDRVHPLVMRALEERVRESRKAWVVAEIPLLFEVGVPPWVDGTVYVTAPEERREERNAFRSLAGKDLARRQRWLLPGEEKRSRAQVVLENGGDLETFLAEGRHLARRFRRMGSAVELRGFCAGEEEARRRGRDLVEARLGARASVVAEGCICRHGAGVVEDRGWTVRVVTLEELVPPAVACWRTPGFGGMSAVTSLPLGRSPWETLVEIEENCR